MRKLVYLGIATFFAFKAVAWKDRRPMLEESGVQLEQRKEKLRALRKELDAQPKEVQKRRASEYEKQAAEVRELERLHKEHEHLLKEAEAVQEKWGESIAQNEKEKNELSNKYHEKCEQVFKDFTAQSPEIKKARLFELQQYGNELLSKMKQMDDRSMELSLQHQEKLKVEREAWRAVKPHVRKKKRKPKAHSSKSRRRKGGSSRRSSQPSRRGV